jgi:hypothetical protein
MKGLEHYIHHSKLSFAEKKVLFYIDCNKCVTFGKASTFYSQGSYRQVNQVIRYGLVYVSGVQGETVFLMLTEVGQAMVALDDFTLT